jgi:hypothetical protein
MIVTACEENVSFCRNEATFSRHRSTIFEIDETELEMNDEAVEIDGTATRSCERVGRIKEHASSANASYVIAIRPSVADRRRSRAAELLHVVLAEQLGRSSPARHAAPRRHGEAPDRHHRPR